MTINRKPTSAESISCEYRISTWVFLNCIADTLKSLSGRGRTLCTIASLFVDSSARGHSEDHHPKISILGQHSELYDFVINSLSTLEVRKPWTPECKEQI